jgi:DNA-directed RNA polymerase specialized sigma24 family protein
MAHAQLDSVLRYIRKVVSHGLPSERTDTQLLAQFAAERDEAAFAALLERHGALVWGVCSRVLNHTQDAEDAFQATFLLLARKATSIRKPQSLGSWLYGVAYRSAIRAKADAAERRVRERRVGDMRQPDPSAEVASQRIRNSLACLTIAAFALGP